jgi:hypothetical protein
MATTPAAPSYVGVIQIGLLGTISNVLAQADTFYRCSVCYGLTDNQTAHTAWHMSIMPQAVSCKVCLLRVLPGDLASHVLFAHGDTPGATVPVL